MAGDAPTSKLAAIVHADVVGFSRLMGEDEAGTHRMLRQYLDAIGSLIGKHHALVLPRTSKTRSARSVTLTFGRI